jgi:hypothetical protein
MRGEKSSTEAAMLERVRSFEIKSLVYSIRYNYFIYVRKRDR